MLRAWAPEPPACLFPPYPIRRKFETRQDPQTRQLVVGAELPGSQHAAKLRRLVVDLAPPQFAAPDPTQPDPTPPGMNSEQHVAVQRVLAAQDYALVLGMPGAGKTTTIVAMVQALVAAGKSVLLTSYTNRWGGRGLGIGLVGAMSLREPASLVP